MSTALITAASAPTPRQGETRDEVRRALRIYMSRTGLTVGELANLTGFAEITVRQFISQGQFGHSPTIGETTARRLASFLELNPAPLPEPPGHLYQTEATREMDAMLAYARDGGWGKVYGPAGAQKTFLLEYRTAEAAREAEPGLVLISVDPNLTPHALLARIAQAIGAPYAQDSEGIRRSIRWTLRRRSTPLAVAVDEAQLLYSRVDTLETLRRLGDAAHSRMGILMAGNEQVLTLFEPRRGNYFEQWRSRIEQREARVLGPTLAEGRRILAAELPGTKEATGEEILSAASVKDPLSKRHYVNARRLFNAIRAFRRAREATRRPAGN